MHLAFIIPATFRSEDLQEIRVLYFLKVLGPKHCRNNECSGHREDWQVISWGGMRVQFDKTHQNQFVMLSIWRVAHLSIASWSTITVLACLFTSLVACLHITRDVRGRESKLWKLANYWRYCAVPPLAVCVLHKVSDCVPEIELGWFWESCWLLTLLLVSLFDCVWISKKHEFWYLCGGKLSMAWQEMKCWFFL